MLFGRVVVLMLLASCTGCGTAAVLVHNPDGKLDAQLPAGWKQITVPDYDAEIIAVNPKHGSCVSVYIAPKYSDNYYIGGHINRSITLDSFVQQCIDYSEKHTVLHDRVVHGPQHLVLNGSPGVRFFTTGKYRDIDCEYLTTMFAAGKECVMVRCWCPAAAFDLNKPDFESITASVVKR